MKYSNMLRELLAGISLDIEDLLLLERFQVSYLPERVPPEEFASLIRKYPFIKNFLASKNPSIESFCDSALKEYEEIYDKNLIAEHCDEVVWEIADLIVYNKHPEIYDEKVNFNWNINEIINNESLKGKVVADVGAGSGMLAFLMAEYAETVYAVEPITSFRSFIRDKAAKNNCTNVYVVDGFLDSIPFPDNMFDYLFTSNAIGWNIEKELQEIERVVKPGGEAIHIIRTHEDSAESPVHDKLTSEEWNYKLVKTIGDKGPKLKYHKTVR
jgi:ubiquinone/menaquinone biosynthesis C-methylase UbiE